MFDAPIHCETYRNLKMRICTNERPATSMVACRKSPYASARTNQWLERRMLRLCTAYYNKVMKESGGKFWKEKVHTLENSPYLTFYGGKTENEGNKMEKSKER